METTLYVIYEEVCDFLSEDYRLNDIIYFSLDKKKAEEVFDFLKRYSQDSNFYLEEKKLNHGEFLDREAIADSALSKLFNRVSMK